MRIVDADELVEFLNLALSLGVEGNGIREGVRIVSTYVERHIKNIKCTEEIKKPPLGIKPKEYWQKSRFTELQRAIAMYAKEGLKIPDEWIEEYNELRKIAD